MTGWKALGVLLLAALLGTTAWAQGGPAAPAQGETVAPGGGPGALNYVEGQASVGNQTVDQKSIGSVQLQPGESLSTGQGKAEILLTPGAFLRVGDDSTVQLLHLIHI